jgi:hypothetical protein
MLLTVPAGSLPAQAASFVARLGNDTMQVERFSVRGTHLEGTVVTAVPSTRIIRWQADLDARGGFARYEASTPGRWATDRRRSRAGRDDVARLAHP